MLEGKFVSVSDVGILSFCYPTFKFTNNLSEWTLQQDVIYNGKYYFGVENDLRLYTKRFISLCGKPDMMIHTKLDWLRLAYSLRNKQVPKYILESYESLDDQDFWMAFKALWVSGKWPIKPVSSSTIFTLFKASTSSFVQFLEVYFSLREEFDFNVLESSFLTFLSKVHHLDDLYGISPSYLRVLNDVRRRVGTKIQPSVKKYLSSERSEINFIDFLFLLFH